VFHSISLFAFLCLNLLLLAATVHSRPDNALASRILPYAVNELHAAEVGGVLVTPSD
jgi:hypothetical protein